MSKLKTKSSAKKRFRATGTGKLVRHAAKHRHNLTVKPRKVKRKQRGIRPLAEGDSRLVRKFLPYA